MTNDASAATKWVIRDLTLDFENGLVIRAGKPITVRHKLFELLAFFARNQNRVVSKDELVLAVWRGAAITDDALTQTVSQARRCIGDQDRKIIRTISKRGFLFASDTPLELGRNAREEPLVRPIVSPEKLFDPNAVHLLRKSNEQEGARANAPIDNFGQKSRNALAGPVQGDATGKEFANTSWGLSKIVPPLLAEAAENTRLFRRLDAALEKPVVWLQGPPGAGKTTLIAKYAAARGRRPIWLRFDAEDGDVATLFFFLGLAEAYARPASGQRRLPVFAPDYQRGTVAFSRNFFRLLFTGSAAPLLVIDDYSEVAGDADAHEMLAVGFREVPAGANVLIASRAAHPNPSRNSA